MSQAKPQLHHLDHLVLTVTDIPASVVFYESVLGMTHTAFTTPMGETRTALEFGQSKINLHQKGAEFEPKANHPTAGSADLCFLTQTPLDTWQVHLCSMGVQIEDGPVPRTGATGPLMSLYLRDPDGNLIEISTQA